MIDATADSEIRAAIFKNCGKQFQMMRRPNIVVTEIGDVGSGCCLNTAIIRNRLRTRVLGKANPADGTTCPSRHLLGVIRAAIRDDDDLERRLRLTQSRLQRWNNKAGTIVSGNDDRKARELFSARKGNHRNLSRDT